MHQWCLLYRDSTLFADLLVKAFESPSIRVFFSLGQIEYPIVVHLSKYLQLVLIFMSPFFSVYFREAHHGKVSPFFHV